MRISDWSSDVCSSNLASPLGSLRPVGRLVTAKPSRIKSALAERPIPYSSSFRTAFSSRARVDSRFWDSMIQGVSNTLNIKAYSGLSRSEEHTSELQSLMRISYAVFCLKKKKPTKRYNNNTKQ